MTRTDTADVVVIGAGIAGAGAAWALSEHCRTILIELESQPGSHATGRSAAVISETSGLPAVCALAAASRRWLDHPRAELGIDSVLSPRGLLWVADDDAASGLDEIEANARDLGIPVDALSGEKARELVPALRPEWLTRAVLEPMAMSIDVARLLDGYIAGFRKRGGVLRCSDPALRLEPTGDRWRLVTPSGTITVEAVVNAAGAWADQVAGTAGLPPIGLQPLRRTAFVFPVDGVSSWPLVMDIGSRFYFEPEGPGLLASPADETPSEPTDARADELDIARAVDALARATTLEVKGVRSSWAGLRTFAPDRLPVVGPDPLAPGLFWLAGQGGGGIKTSPALAHYVTGLVVDGCAPDELGGVDLGPFHGQISPDRLVR